MVGGGQEIVENGLRSEKSASMLEHWEKESKEGGTHVGFWELARKQRKQHKFHVHLEKSHTEEKAET